MGSEWIDLADKSLAVLVAVAALYQMGRALTLARQSSAEENRRLLDALERLVEVVHRRCTDDEPE